MKINCSLKGAYKEKKEKDDRYHWIDIYYLGQYEEHPKLFDVKYKLCIHTIDNNGDEGEVLVSKEFIKTGKATHNISFYNVTYQYDERTNQIISLTTIHNI